MVDILASMRYLIALLVPPLAILFCGKPFQALLNLPLWVVGIALLFVGIGLLIVPLAILHALMVVHSHLADRRSQRLVAAVQSRR